MSSIKRSAVVLFGVAALVANTTGACSSDSGGEGFSVPDDAGGHPVLPESGALGDATSPEGDADLGEGGPIQIDASDGDGSLADSGYDAGTDAGTDAGVDAGADAGATGSPCPTDGLIGTEACGLCGFHTRLCTATTAGGPKVWQPWGFCQDEVVGGCVPGTMDSQTCGKCGTRQRVCQMDCSYAVGACVGEPAGACTPGTVDYEDGLSCAVGGRERTCTNTCTYGMFGACVTHSTASSLTIPTTVGATTSGEFTLALTKTTSRLSTGSCPTTVSATATPYAYVELDNPGTSTIKVSVWGSQSSHAGAPSNLDTVIAAYAGATVPATDAARDACVGSVNDTCTTHDVASECLGDWAGLVGTNAVTIGPNAKALIYVATYFDDDSGDFLLTARADTVTP